MAVENHSYGPKVEARARLAEQLLQEAHGARRRAAGLKDNDLTEIRDRGAAARAADDAQADQTSEIKAKRSDRALGSDEVLTREQGLKDRLSAAILDLNASHAAHAKWLAGLSASRYRLIVREVAGSEDAEAQAQARSVERVEREDKLSRLAGAAKFARLLLLPGREPVVAELAERGFGTPELEALVADAEALVAAGKNVRLSAEATAREAEAAAAQAKRWSATRRMIAAACSGDERLSKMLADC